MAAEAEGQQGDGIGLEISWKHTANRRRIKFQFGDSHITISHPMTPRGASDASVLAQILPQGMERVRAAIEAQVEESDGIDH